MQCPLKLSEVLVSHLQGSITNADLQHLLSSYLTRKRKYGMLDQVRQVFISLLTTRFFLELPPSPDKHIRSEARSEVLADEDGSSDAIDLIESPLFIRDENMAQNADIGEDSPADQRISPPAGAPVAPVVNLSDTSSIEAQQLSANSKELQEELLRLSQLDSTFPPPIKGQFQPSEFQRAVLQHMTQRREGVGHKMGLVVMATAVGKTVLAILDIQNELEQMRSENAQLVQPAAGLPNALGQFMIGRSSSASPPTSDSKRVPPVSEPNAPSNAYLSDEDFFPRKKNAHVLPTATTTSASSTAVSSQRPFRLLFLVHTKAIRDATFTKFSAHFRARGFPGASFLNVQATTSLSPQSLRRAQFVFCLFQSFERVASEISDHVTHLVVDECHHLLAATYREVYRTLVHSPALRYCLGMTATLIHRDDPAGQTLKEMFRGQVYIDFPWPVAKALGHFPKVEYLECLPTLQAGRDVPTYDAILSAFHSGQISLNTLLNRLESSVDRCGMTADKVKDILTPRYVVEMFLQYQESRRRSGIPEKRKVILFAANCEDADEIASLFVARKVSAVAAHYKSAKQAALNLQQFCQGDISVLVTVMMVNEGFDSAEVDCVVMGRLTESEIVFVQQMGRGLRKSRKLKNKEVCIIDLALNLRRRWRRLQKETSDKHLIQLLKQFWHVDNFVGVNFA